MNKQHVYNEEDVTISTLEVQLNKIITRYVARTLAELENSHHSHHNKIVKKQFWFAKDDIQTLIQNNS